MSIHPCYLSSTFWCWGSRPKNQYIVQIMCWVLRDLMAPVHGNVKYVLRFYLRGSFDWSGQQGRRPIKVKQNSPHLTLPCPSQVSRYPTWQMFLGHYELPCKYRLTLKSINIKTNFLPIKTERYETGRLLKLPPQITDQITLISKAFES